MKMKTIDNPTAQAFAVYWFGVGAYALPPTSIVYVTIRTVDLRTVSFGVATDGMTTRELRLARANRTLRDGRQGFVTHLAAIRLQRLARQRAWLPRSFGRKVGR